MQLCEELEGDSRVMVEDRLLRTTGVGDGPVQEYDTSEAGWGVIVWLQEVWFVWIYEYVVLCKAFKHCL